MVNARPPGALPRRQRGDSRSSASAEKEQAAWPTKRAVDECRRCPLWERATQGVAGEGPRSASLVLVGEQPGDEEDLAGRPFVGPAGRMLRGLLDELGIDHASVYITNAVKHFSWEPRGKRRLHKTPAQREMEACHIWLEGELETLKPRVIVALGATALAALMRRRVKVGEARASVLHLPEGIRVMATFHPSAVLRAPDPERKDELMRLLRDDLEAAARLAGLLK
jgi:DNA polymerase